MKARHGGLGAFVAACLLTSASVAWADEASPTDSATDLETHEEGHEPYFFMGLRFRDYILPEFMLDAFATGGTTVNAATIGPEFTYREGGIEFDVALTYADYSMDPTLFKGRSKKVEKLERVASDLKLIYATVDVLYEISVEEQSRAAFLFGFGAGFAVVVDNLRRNQIYPKNPSKFDIDNPDEWVDCESPADPLDPADWCGEANNHYGNYDEPSWANGGSKPNVVPYLAFPQFAFRYKPIKELQARFDAGFALTNGFFLGLSVGYGL
jgi:hypothetical protein